MNARCGTNVRPSGASRRGMAMSPVVQLAALAACLAPASCGAVPAAAAAAAPAPKIASASPEGELAVARIKVPAGLRVELVAAEPLVANPVALWIDERGRILVCETFRQGRAVTDNRKHDRAWVDADLAARTVADREAYHRRLLGDAARVFTEHDDRIRLLEDTDGDGRADRSEVFADGFNGLVEGTGAGVLARGSDVYFTNIPHLWRLRDADGDGRAEDRTSLAAGFGVKVAYRGHDMHGLTIGPDGRLYWSIGDRGYHVELPDGRVLSDPASGAVFRCELDGSGIEVFATGLRNPQELAFDDHGNLFTGDNNSDSGDKARWVYLVRGGDSGWRMHYQYLGDRGPFNREKIWYPHDAESPAYVVPPIANFADGPAGLTFYPGTGLPDRYCGAFLLCDFRGGPGTSGIHAVQVRPKGAGFELVHSEPFAWGVLATDCDFGPDGGLYVTDWVDGWEGLGKGRIYKVFDPASAASPVVAEVRRLLAEGMATRSTAALAGLLAHADRRVRQEAQFELAARLAIPELAHAAARGEAVGERLAGVWGLGQIARRAAAGPAATARAELLPLLDDANDEVVCQAARQVGETTRRDAAAAVGGRLVSLLGHANLRVRFFAAEALGLCGDRTAIDPLLTMLAENADRDRHLRHAGVMGLAGVADVTTLTRLTGHDDAAVRLAAVLALRRLRSPAVAASLADADERIVLEAARAIHDLPIEEALPQLAALADRRSTSDPLLRRILNANNRLGHAAVVADFAGRSDAPTPVRLTALRNLRDWAKPQQRDPFHSGWWPLEPRDAAAATAALRPLLPMLLGSAPLRDQAAKTAAALGMPEASQALVALLADAEQPGEVRAEALAVLGQLRYAALDDLLMTSLDDPTAPVRGRARDLLAKRDAAAALPLLAKAVAAGEVREAQMAIDTLAALDDPEADSILAGLLDALLRDELAAELRLELVEGARRRRADAVRERLARYEATRDPDDPVATHRECVAGGDAARGRRIFFEKVEVSCVRCHRVADVGGEVGPNLTRIGGKPRPYLLEAIVDPNRAIAPGFDTLVAVTDDGRSLTGVVRREDATTITLVDADGRTHVLDKDSIEERIPGRSSMPADLVKQLSDRELRDLVEYLTTLGD